jgi:hypothetical protein
VLYAGSIFGMIYYGCVVVVVVVVRRMWMFLQRLFYFFMACIAKSLVCEQKFGIYVVRCFWVVETRYDGCRWALVGCRNMRY